MTSGQDTSPVRGAEPRAAVLRGRLHTLLSLDGDDTAFATLVADAESTLGAEHSVSLLIRAVLQQRLSYHRTVEESAAAWEGLRQRASASLPDQDPTLLLIRSHHIRFLRLRARPGDLDRAVTLRENEIAAREAHLPGHDNRLGIARADLAVALIDRARTMARCGGQHTDPDADLARAEDLIDPEIRRRKAVHKDETSLVNGSRLIHTELYVALAERAFARGDDQEALDHARKGTMIARPLIETSWPRDRRSLGALKSRLLLAESLALSGQLAGAARAARLACHVAGLVTENIDRGWPPFVLARIMGRLDAREARRTAERALAKRDLIFPGDSCRIIEIREFIGSLDACGNGENTSPPPDR